MSGGQVKPYSFQQLLTIIKHSYGYTQHVNTVKFLIDRSLKLAPWVAPLGILGAFLVYPCIPDSVKWEYSLPYSPSKTNIRLNQIPVEKPVEENFN